MQERYFSKEFEIFRKKSENIISQYAFTDINFLRIWIISTLKSTIVQINLTAQEKNIWIQFLGMSPYRFVTDFAIYS